MEGSARAGNVIASRFTLNHEIGRGGTAVVWAASDPITGKRVAIKLVAPHEAHDPVVNDRFARECDVLMQCQIDQVVRVEASGYDAIHGLFLAMELLEGETLEQRLVRVGVLSAADLRRVARDVATALSHLHGLGITHRDLKPANIFLVQDASGELCAKLLDFGTVKLSENADRHGRTEAGALVGTPSRMSPEQARAQFVDHRTDIWAFAMVAFEALVGSQAIDGTMPVGQVVLAVCHARLPVPSQLNASVDHRFDAWFARSTALAPKDRFDSVEEQWYALTNVLEPSTCTARRMGRAAGHVRTVLIDATHTMTLPPLAPRRRPIASTADSNSHQSGGSSNASAKHRTQDTSMGRW